MEKWREILRKKRKTQGNCVDCNQITSGFTYCSVCLSKKREKRKQRKVNAIKRGICTKCNEKTLLSLRVCEKHLLQRTSYRHFGTTKHWQKLREMFYEQGGICDYSGEQLRLGINAELDHISPLFMGGENGLKNVHWVIGTINRFKGFQAEKDFLNLIKKIYEFKIKS